MAIVSLLSLVEQFAKNPPLRTAIFNLNNGEEEGLCGSHVLVNCIGMVYYFNAIFPDSFNIHGQRNQKHLSIWKVLVLEGLATLIPEF